MSSSVIGENLLTSITNGTRDGIKMAVNVAAMILVFVALIALLNGILFQIAEIFNLNIWEKAILFINLFYRVNIGLFICSLMWLIGVQLKTALMDSY